MDSSEQEPPPSYSSVIASSQQYPYEQVSVSSIAQPYDNQSSQPYGQTLGSYTSRQTAVPIQRDRAQSQHQTVYVPAQHQREYDYHQGQNQPEYGQVVVTKEPMVTTQSMMLIGPSYSAPGDYLCLSVFATIFCCVPTGIAAIIYATQTRRLLETGQVEEARKTAKCSRNLILASIILGISCMIIAAVIVGRQSRQLE